MNSITRHIAFSLAGCFPIMAGTVVITSIPDEEHTLPPLASGNGISLAPGAEIRVGAFPGMSDDELLDAAATGGLEGITSAFAAFGEPSAIGEGVDGAAGRFEIAVSQEILPGESSLAEEEISLLIRAGGSGEFLVARFGGHVFTADSATGLDPLLALHLTDAKVVIGNRYGTSQLVTSPAPEIGSYANWMAEFAGIGDPAKRLPEADADGDGRSNFLEYATGGDPASPADAPPCQIYEDDGGVMWLRFSSEPGLGSVRYILEQAGGLQIPWQAIDAMPQPDPEPPASGMARWMRVPVPMPIESHGFFRLKVESP